MLKVKPEFLEPPRMLMSEETIIVVRDPESNSMNINGIIRALKSRVIEGMHDPVLLEGEEIDTESVLLIEREVERVFADFVFDYQDEQAKLESRQALDSVVSTVKRDVNDEYITFCEGDYIAYLRCFFGPIGPREWVVIGLGGDNCFCDVIPATKDIDRGIVSIAAFLVYRRQPVDISDSVVKTIVP